MWGLGVEAASPLLSPPRGEEKVEWAGDYTKWIRDIVYLGSNLQDRLRASGTTRRRKIKHEIPRRLPEREGGGKPATLVRRYGQQIKRCTARFIPSLGCGCWWRTVNVVRLAPETFRLAATAKTLAAIHRDLRAAGFVAWFLIKDKKNFGDRPMIGTFHVLLASCCSTHWLTRCSISRSGRPTRRRDVGYASPASERQNREQLAETRGILLAQQRINLLNELLLLLLQPVSQSGRGRQAASQGQDISSNPPLELQQCKLWAKLDILLLACTSDL